MPQPSTIDRLPDDIKATLQQLLQDPRITQLEVTSRINELLEAEGHEDRVSKSAVNRYAVKMSEIGEDLRQSREIADMWVAKLGSPATGNVGMLVVEMIRTMSFEVSMAIRKGGLDPESAPETIKMLKDLALTSMRLEKSASDNVKREREVRKEALEQAAAQIEKTAVAAGVSAEAIQTIRRDVLRMAV